MTADLSINILLLVLLFGGLIKALITIGLLGLGLGFSGLVFSVATLALSLLLSVVMIQPVLGIPEVSVFSIGKQVELTTEGYAKLTSFLQKNTAPEVTQALSELANNKSYIANSTELLGLGFLLTELKEAFLFGALLLLPFLLIDFLLGLIFSAVGIQVLSVRQLALPLKLLLFISVDGWLLLSSNFLNNYSF